MSAGFVLKQTKGFLDVPLSTHTPVFLGCAAFVAGMAWLNSAFFTPVVSQTPDFLAEQAKIGNVMARTEAPAVFLNPIWNGIPGNILGPDDLPK